MNVLLDILAFGAIISGVLVITSKNPVISVLFLISVFINTSLYLLTLGIDFIAISYLIVYVGAIAILFLFVIMILNINTNNQGRDYLKNLPLGIIVSYLLFFEMLWYIPTTLESVNTSFIIYTPYLNLTSKALISYDNFSFNYQINTIGQELYTYGSIWLLILSIILLLAIIGPITLCLQTRKISPLEVYKLIV